MSLQNEATPEDAPGARHSFPSQQEEDESEVTEALVHLLNLAVVIRTVTAGCSSEQQTYCHMCHQYDRDHLDGCPVPALEGWLAKYS